MKSTSIADHPVLEKKKKTNTETGLLKVNNMYYFVAYTSCEMNTPKPNAFM